MNYNLTKLSCRKRIKVALTAILLSLLLIPLYGQDKGQTKINELFKMSFEELMDVTVITAEKTLQKVSDIPASVVVITRKDIEKYGFTSLDRILENVPGLFNIDNRFEGAIFGVRGFWSAIGNNIILLVNGIRQERMESDGTVYTAIQIPVEAIDRIEVIRGPMSVIYGPGAFFGAINIITNDADNGSHVALSAGSEETVRAAARVAVKKDDVSLVFNAGYLNTKGPDIPHSRMTTQDWSEKYGTAFTSTKGLWGNRLEYFSLYGSYKGFYANFQYNENYREWYLFRPPNTSDGSKFWRSYSTFAFGYKHEFSLKFKMDARLSYRRGFTRGNFGWLIPEDGMNISGDFNNKEDYEVDVTAFLQPYKNLHITAGLYYKEKATDQLQGSYPQFGNFFYRIGLQTPLKRSAAYCQADISPLKWIKLTMGARLEYMQPYTTFFADIMSLTGNTAKYDPGKIDYIPRLSSIFYLHKNHILKLLYGRAITMPSIFKTAARASNPLQPLIEPEYISTLELNYLAALAGGISLNFSIFYNDLDNLIVNDSDWNEERTEFVPSNKNSGELKTIGSELTVIFKPLDNIYTELSVTCQNTVNNRNEYSNIDVAYSPNFLAYFKAAYSFNENSVFSINARYVGSMETSWDKSILSVDSSSYGARIADRTDGYLVIGANLRFNNLFDSKFYLNINGSNLLGSEYLFPSYTFNASFADKGMPGYNRILQVAIGKEF
ncbi:TonB-dependent receptor [bacterium]|nr:TonB-dependent receptor [bacterium]